MLSAGFPQSAAAGRNALDTFMKDNLYKYDVIAMKDTDTGTQTYIVADKGPVHPVRNGSQDGQKNNARGGERYSLRTTTDGKVVAVVDEDILSGINLAQWNDATKEAVKAAARKALKRFEDGIVVNGVTRKANKTTRREYTKSSYSEMLARKFPTRYVDKMRAASALDDIVVAATDWARDGKLIHPRADNFVDFDHGNVLIETKGHKYNAEVVVGITDKGESVFYDVVDIQPAIFTLEKQEPSTNVTTNESPDVVHEGSLADNIHNSSKNVNSVSDQTETENFKKWFGDWEKNPTKASKVVNADGTPKVVYHGTNAELKGGAEYLKQVVQVQKKHHLPESAAFLPVTAPIRRRTGPAYRGPHGRRRRARAGR